MLQNTGSMEKEYNSISGTTANRLEILKNKGNAAGITLGNILLPSIIEMADSAGNAVDKIGAFAEKYPTLTGGAVKLTETALLAGGIGFCDTKVWSDHNICTIFISLGLNDKIRSDYGRSNSKAVAT